MFHPMPALAHRVALFDINEQLGAELARERAGCFAASMSRVMNRSTLGLPRRAPPTGRTGF